MGFSTQETEIFLYSKDGENKKELAYKNEEIDYEEDLQKIAIFIMINIIQNKISDVQLNDTYAM